MHCSRPTLLWKQNQTRTLQRRKNKRSESYRPISLMNRSTKILNKTVIHHDLVGTTSGMQGCFSGTETTDCYSAVRQKEALPLATTRMAEWDEPEQDRYAWCPLYVHSKIASLIDTDWNGGHHRLEGGEKGDVFPIWRWVSSGYLIYSIVMILYYTLES